MAWRTLCTSVASVRPTVLSFCANDPAISATNASSSRIIYKILVGLTFSLIKFFQFHQSGNIRGSYQLPIWPAWTEDQTPMPLAIRIESPGLGVLLCAGRFGSLEEFLLGLRCGKEEEERCRDALFLARQSLSPKEVTLSARFNYPHQILIDSPKAIYISRKGFDRHFVPEVARS